MSIPKRVFQRLGAVAQAAGAPFPLWPLADVGWLPLAFLP
jgi:hypothetical protein